MRWRDLSLIAPLVVSFVLFAVDWTLRAAPPDFLALALFVYIVEMSGDARIRLVVLGEMPLAIL
jgi:hypothetical protein